MRVCKIGIDLGGSKIESVLLDPEDALLERKRIPTPRKEGYDAILSSLAALIRQNAASLTRFGFSSDMHCSVGIGIPGMIDLRSGLVKNANTTCLIARPMQKDLESILQRRVCMLNDADCFVQAECHAGAGKGHSVVFGVIMGTGCGGGISLDGKVVQGAHGIRGEWGHMSMDPLGVPCYCGKIGCVETMISGSGVETRYRERAKKDSLAMSMQQITAGYRRGDPLCTEIFLKFIDDFGRALGAVISLLDPDAIVLGGGLSKIDELYDIGVKKARHYAFYDELDTPILKNQLGDAAGVFGAAWAGIV